MKYEVDNKFSFSGNEERTNKLINSLRVGVLLQGPQTEILFSNKAALNMLGLTEDELYGRSSFHPEWNVIHEDGSPFPGSTYPVPTAITTKKPVTNVIMGVYRPVTKDRVWLLVNAEPLLDDKGEIKEVICSCIPSKDTGGKINIVLQLVFPSVDFLSRPVRDFFAGGAGIL